MERRLERALARLLEAYVDLDSAKLLHNNEHQWGILIFNTGICMWLHYDYCSFKTPISSVKTMPSSKMS